LQPPTTALADCAAYSRNCAAAYGGWALKTDHWFYGLCHSTPDLITLLLPGAAAASLGPDASGDAIYRFEAPELKTVNHRLDGALWPLGNERGPRAFASCSSITRCYTWPSSSCPTGGSGWGRLNCPLSLSHSWLAFTG